MEDLSWVSEDMDEDDKLDLEDEFKDKLETDGFVAVDLFSGKIINEEFKEDK